MRTFLGFPIQTWGIICLAAAVGYFFKWPRPRAEEARPPRSRAVHIVLRWFHSIVWLLLAAACFLWAQGPSMVANALAGLALVVYLVFLFTLLSDRRMEAPS